MYKSVQVNVSLPTWRWGRRIVRRLCADIGVRMKDARGQMWSIKESNGATHSLSSIHPPVDAPGAPRLGRIMCSCGNHWRGTVKYVLWNDSRPSNARQQEPRPSPGKLKSNYLVSIRLVNCVMHFWSTMCAFYDRQSALAPPDYPSISLLFPLPLTKNCTLWWASHSQFAGFWLPRLISTTPCGKINIYVDHVSTTHPLAKGTYIHEHVSLLIFTLWWFPSRI